MKIGGSISYQLVDIFSIIDSNLPEQEKREKVSEYQKSLTSRYKETSIIMGDEGENGSNIKNGCFIFGAIDVMTYEELCAAKDYVEKNLSSLTCEAEMKMLAIVRGYDKETHSIQYNFELADKVYDYAISKGKEIRGHTLVWHNHEPQALDDYIEDRLGCSMEEYKLEYPEVFAQKRRQYTLDFLRDYMKMMGEHYPECYCWDVINEIVPDMYTDKPTEHERETGLRDSKWNEYIGQDEEGNDWYIEVLKIARETLPEGTKLTYNEYGEQYPEKRETWQKMFELSEDYNLEYFTGWGINDNLSWYERIDGTMVDKDGVVKDFAKDFIERQRDIKKCKAKSTQELGKEVSDVILNVAYEDETERNQEEQEKQLEEKMQTGQNL